MGSVHGRGVVRAPPILQSVDAGCGMQDAGRGVREESALSCCGAEACGEVPIHICVACRARYTETMTVR